MITSAIGQAMMLIQAVCIFWSPDSVMFSAQGFMIGSAILTFALSRSQLSKGWCFRSFFGATAIDRFCGRAIELPEVCRNHDGV
jgi:hypothetical protein